MKQYQDWRLVSNLLNLNIITHMLLFAYYSVCILSLMCFCLGQERKDQRLLTANTVLPKRQQKSELWYNLSTIYIFLLVMPESRKAATSMKAATCQLYTIGKEVISRKKGRVPSHWCKYTQSHYVNIHIGCLWKTYRPFCFFLPNNHLFYPNFPLQVSGIFLTM